MIFHSKLERSSTLRFLFPLQQKILFVLFYQGRQLFLPRQSITSLPSFRMICVFILSLSLICVHTFNVHIYVVYIILLLYFFKCNKKLSNCRTNYCKSNITLIKFFQEISYLFLNICDLLGLSFVFKVF